MESVLTHLIKQYPTSQAITGAVIRNHREIQVCVFMAILRAVNWLWTDWMWFDLGVGNSQRQ